MVSQYVTAAVINTEATNENQDEHEDPPDDSTEEATTEQVALSAALALISAPWHIPDQILFPGNGELSVSQEHLRGGYAVAGGEPVLVLLLQRQPQFSKGTKHIYPGKDQ
ncbi:unnamed protein product [Phytophthora fragariaefolia]|uniref:Unnamed protein product n=1 Tax=Phytophthora fragariaefolia TaxID=1490495 RepID=A0A9W6TKS0_9STRA|nr:unnamed protein product [Phytophthora fragariaefolia]